MSYLLYVYIIARAHTHSHTHTHTYTLNLKTQLREEKFSSNVTDKYVLCGNIKRLVQTAIRPCCVLRVTDCNNDVTLPIGIVLSISWINYTVVAKGRCAVAL